MKKEFNRHGKRLTTREYERAIVALYTGAPPMPDAAEDARLRRAELDFSIDHKLGVDFPAARRDQMWLAAEKTEKNRVVTAFKIIASHILHGRGGEKHMDGGPGDARFLTGQVAKNYAAVLDSEELEQFLGARQDRVLPPNTWRR